MGRDTLQVFVWEKQAQHAKHLVDLISTSPFSRILGCSKFRPCSRSTADISEFTAPRCQFKHVLAGAEQATRTHTSEFDG